MPVSTSIPAPRDLAWCRAAFRDLDAPLPGQASAAADRPRRGWATGPVEAGPLAHRLGPRPDTAGLVERVVAESGHHPRRVDDVGAVLLAWDEITRVGCEHLRVESAAAQALRTVRGRWDLQEPMLWHVFGHHGEPGLVAHRAVVHELFTTGGLHRTLTAAVGSGALLRF